MRSVYTEKFQCLKWVWESRILKVERRGPMNTSISSKTARSDDISQVKLIVGWNELAKLTKMETSSVHWNVPQRKYVINKPLPNKSFQWANR